MSAINVDLHGLKFDISQDEFDYLMKLPEEDRLYGLCRLRYEFHVLHKQGKKKTVDTMKMLESRQAIRFACAFFRHGQTK